MELERNSLLRFITAGSVDDGKSTLIGRLLYDTKSIFEDQITAVKQTSARKGQHEVDLSMFTDGLKDEVAQGITIDVAYRYFTTPKRKFIIADSPGHFEFTRNMVTAASTANAAVILIDAKNGITEQTKRHSYIASLLRIEHVIVCINKMDLLNWDANAFETITKAYAKMSEQLHLNTISYIPMSALTGDNVVQNSTNMPWYSGKTLLEKLEAITITNTTSELRLPIQTVINNTSESNVLGQIVSGTLTNKQQLKIATTSKKLTSNTITKGYEEITTAQKGEAVLLTVELDKALTRGQILIPFESEAKLTTELTAMLCWFDPEIGALNTSYLLQQSTTSTTAEISEITFEVDIATYAKKLETNALHMNAIAQVKIKTTDFLMHDSYESNPATGSFILIDKKTNRTLAAGIIC